MLCNIDDCLLIFPGTLRLHWLQQVSSIEQCMTSPCVSHVHTIMEHSFPVAVPCLIWTTKHISRWLKNSQLSCYIIIDFIFKAVFFIKVKANISLYSKNFATASYSLNKVVLFEIIGILGAVEVVVIWLANPEVCTKN